MEELKVCVVVPTYNNGGTVADVVARVMAVAPHVVVVVDGSTDDTVSQLDQLRRRLPVAQAEGLHVEAYADNRGKGYALKTGFKHAISQGFEYAITIDSDGQLQPEEIPLFVEVLKTHPEAFVVGARNLSQTNMPGGNTFANKFSNFWFAVQTWHRLPDTQTGFRLYPLRLLSGIHFITSRYEAELELLVFAAWSGVQLIPVPVSVYYPPQGERVTHFRPVADFMRITVLNTVLCCLALCYGWPRMLINKLKRRSHG